MLVVYRMTSIASSNPPPVLADDKNALNELCLKSFVKAFEDVQPKIIFLLDNCTCKDMVKRVCPFEMEILESNIGINETMLRSYALASQFDDFVLFCECDYLWQPNIGKKYLFALADLKLVSPYDHANFYRDKTLHSEDVKIRLIDNHHFRTTERNTMTFGLHTNLLKAHRATFDKYGYLDGDVWYDLKSEGVSLWVPIPSFATHCVKDYLAPSILWTFE